MEDRLRLKEKELRFNERRIEIE